MKILTFDIETDGLLHECTQVYLLIAQDVSTGTVYTFTDHDDRYPSLSDGFGYLNMADALVGHNILGFDLPALKKIYGWRPLAKVKLYDTWIMSQVCSFRRSHKQGLAGWGEKFGYPKLEFDDFTKYSDEMRKYCQRDVELNTKVYKHLCHETSIIKQRNPLFSKGLEIEHRATQANAIMAEQGWRFDLEGAQRVLKELTEKMKVIEDEIEPSLPEITRKIDAEPKEPKYTKAGDYTAATARMLSEHFDREVRPTEARLSNPPIKPGECFQRVRVEKATLGSMESVKEYLFSLGWKPDDYNVKKINGRWIKQSPKLTTTSLEKLGEIGLKIDKYYTYRNRKSVLEGWMDHAALDGRLRGNMWVQGTPTFRVRHEVITNLPGVDVPYGRELRSLFLPEEGHVLVGADSSGNQARALAHYAADADLTAQILDGDFHQFNADIVGCDRKTAKNWLYAYLYGAGDAKLGQILTGKSDAARGKKSRETYGNRIPGLKKLNENLKSVWQQRNTVPALDGRSLYIDKDYQCLNYLLQGAEAITCKAALAYAMDKVEEEGLDAEIRLFYHDEMQWTCSKGDSERLAEILAESFKEGPKWFGVEIMDGESVIGANLAETH